MELNEQSRDQLLKDIKAILKRIEEAAVGEQGLFVDEHERLVMKEDFEHVIECAEIDEKINPNPKTDYLNDSKESFKEFEDNTYDLKKYLELINKENESKISFIDVVKTKAAGIKDTTIQRFTSGRQWAKDKIHSIGEFCKDLGQKIKDLGIKGYEGSHKKYHAMMASLHEHREKHLSELFDKIVKTEIGIQAKDAVKADKSARRTAFFKNIGIRMQNFVASVTNVNRALSFSNIAAIARGEAPEYEKVEKKPFIDPVSVNVNRGAISKAVLGHLDDKLADIAVERALNKSKVLIHTLEITPREAREAVVDKYIGSIIEGLEQPSTISRNVLGNEFLNEPLEMTTVDGQRFEIGYDGVRIDGKPAFTDSSRLGIDRDGNTEVMGRWSGISHVLSPDQITNVLLVAERDRLVSVYEREAFNIDDRLEQLVMNDELRFSTGEEFVDYLKTSHDRLEQMNRTDERDLNVQLGDHNEFVDTARMNSSEFRDISFKLDELLNQQEAADMGDKHADDNLAYAGGGDER